MRFHDAEMLRQLRAACDRHGAPLIFDEIFVGFGRLGEALFACAEAGVTPEIITLSKALTGGTLPPSATIDRGRVFDAFLSDDPAKSLLHCHTHMAERLVGKRWVVMCSNR